MQHADAPAIRAFHDALVAKESPWAAHPRDYDLCSLGVINDETAEIAAHTTGRLVVATGRAYVEQLEKQNNG